MKGNPDFLCHIPDSVGYVIDALQRLSGFGDLAEALTPVLRSYLAKQTEGTDA